MAETISRRSIVYDITFNTAGAQKSAKGAEKAIEGIDKKAAGMDDLMKGLAKSIGAAFAVEKILSFAKEASELADKAQAIKSAFDKLNGVSLNKLREATGGAVDDIVLMQKAVQASNFKIPLGELEKLFRFATIRAKETGESVNDLVDAVIEGLGGGSARAFKALGISANEFQATVKRTGDVTKAVTSIIDSNFKRTGDSLDGLVDAGDKLSASFTNFQIAVGGLINDGFLDDFKDTLGSLIQITTDLITGQTGYNEELEKTHGLVKQFTEDDVKNMLVAADLLIEVRKQEADQGRKLSEIEIQAIKDGFEAKAAALIASTKLVQQETDKQVAIAREKQEDIFFDPELFEKQRQALLKGLQQISDMIVEKNEGGELKVKPTIDNTDLQKYGAELLALGVQTATFAEVIKESSGQIGQDMASIFGSFASLAKQGSEAQLALSIANILAANAEAIAKAIAAASGTPWPANIPAIISSVAAVTSTFAQVNTILSQARAAQANASSVSAFAEGEVDIHRPGETRGKDSIPAILMPGESVLTAKRTRENRPLIEAIHAGTVDELIKVNYVEPALALQALSGSKSDSLSIPDYSDRLYRQYLATDEGNRTAKRMLGALSSIDRKLTDKKARHH